MAASSSRAADEEAKEEPKKRRWRRVRESILRPKREASFSTLSDVVLMLPYLERRAPLLRYSVRQREFLALVVAYTVVPWFFLVMSRRIVGTAFLWCVTLIYGVGGLASMGGSGYINEEEAPHSGVGRSRRRAPSRSPAGAWRGCTRSRRGHRRP